MRNKRPTRNLHYRELDYIFYEKIKVDPQFALFVKKRILPDLTLKGYKLPEKQKTAIHCIQNLLIAFARDKVVADTRDNSTAGLRIGVWDSLIDAGLVNVCKGSEMSGRISLYRASAKLVNILKRWKKAVLDYKLARNTERSNQTEHALVVIRPWKKDSETGKKLQQEQRQKPVSFKELPRPLQNYIGFTEDQIELINRNNLSHSWQAFRIDPDTGKKFVFSPNVCIREIHSGHLGRCTRLYSWSEISGQTLSKAERKTILIDGEPVVELDFSGYLTRRIYHLEQIDPGAGDIYRPRRILPAFYQSEFYDKATKKIAREVIKRATNICFNVVTRQRAGFALRKWIQDQNENTRTIIYDILKIEGIDHRQLIRRVIKTHPQIRKWFFRVVFMFGYLLPIGDIMMSLDGAVMLHILWHFTKTKRPALGIHDSILCRQSDEDFARKTMIDVYRKWHHGYFPVIKLSQ